MKIDTEMATIFELIKRCFLYENRRKWEADKVFVFCMKIGTEMATIFKRTKRCVVSLKMVAISVPIFPLISVETTYLQIESDR